MSFAAALAAEKARLEAAIAAAYAEDPLANREELWQRYAWLYAASASQEAGTIVLGVFQATADGKGYSTGDILIYRQTPPDAPEYVNTTTGLVVTPDGADLGTVGGSVVTANAGTNLNTSLLALEDGGNLAAIAGSIGATSATVASSDTGTFALIPFIKRSLQRLSNIYAILCTGTFAGGAADNSTVSGTISAPGAGKAIFIKNLVFSYGATPGSVRILTVTSDGSDLVNFGITAGGAGPVPVNVLAPTNTAVRFSLPASGTAGVFGRLRIYYSIVDVL